MPRLKIPVMALEPSLWGTLPKELLHLVFAHLPVAGIGQLRVLSKEWKRNVDCKDSDFNQVLDATPHVNMFALLHCGVVAKRMGMLASCDIYDVQADEWHVFETDGVYNHFGTEDGVDGGLVCCVLINFHWSVSDPGLCIVWNPLTKQKTQLPPMLCMETGKSFFLTMMKLTMDKKTKEYKVFVVGTIGNGDGACFVYDSHIKGWTIVEATHGHIFGWSIIASMLRSKFPGVICKYNCADGTLQVFNEFEIAPELKVKAGGCVLLEDHLFVLHKEVSPGPPDLLEDGESIPPKYCISEFHLPEKATTWVKLGVHSCDPCKIFRNSPYGRIKWRLYGCTGYLLIYGEGYLRSWLYNLSTCEWRHLPAFKSPIYPRLMCTISWSAMA